MPTAADASMTAPADFTAKGESIFKTINGYTKDEEYSKVSETLDSINKDNVLSFLDGYFKAKDKKFLNKQSPEGIIEHLDDENDKGAISMRSKLNLVKSVLELAKANGLDQIPELDKTVETLEKIYNQYTTGDLKNASDFDNNKKTTWKTAGKYASKGSSIGSCIGAAIGACCYGQFIIGSLIGSVAGAAGGALTSCFDPTTDDERIDECIKTIYNALAGAEA